MAIGDLTNVEYLGDSVYAGWDGSQVWIWTDNGYGRNEVRQIALNASVIMALVAYNLRCQTKRLSDAVSEQS